MAIPSPISTLEEMDRAIRALVADAMLASSAADQSEVPEGKVLSVGPLNYDTPFRAEEVLENFKRPTPAGLLSAPRVTTEFPRNNAACTLVFEYQWCFVTDASGGRELDSDDYRRRLAFANYDYFMGAFWRTSTPIPNAPTSIPHARRIVPGEMLLYPTERFLLMAVQFRAEIWGYAPRAITP